MKKKSELKRGLRGLVGPHQRSFYLPSWNTL